MLRGSREPSRVVGREEELLEEKMEVEKIGVPFEFGVLGAIVKKRRGEEISYTARGVRPWVQEAERGRGRGSV